MARCGHVLVLTSSASQELQAQFTSFLTSSDFALLATITNESLVPISTIADSSSFGSNLTALQEHLELKQALYIIIRRFDTAPPLLGVTYVPDAAPVRQKMLFASTRLTLVRELGREHFRETILVNNPAELTEQGFKKHDAHEKLAAPLTEEERTLGEVKRAEAEAGSGTGTREIHLSKTLSMPMDEDTITAMKEVGEGGRLVTMLVSNPLSRA